MKVLLDLENLSKNNTISPAIYGLLIKAGVKEKYRVVLALLLLGASLGLASGLMLFFPYPLTAILLGLLGCTVALGPIRFHEHYNCFSFLLALLGALFFIDGIIWYFDAATVAWVVATVCLGVGGIIGRYNLFVTLALVTLAVAIGDVAYDPAHPLVLNVGRPFVIVFTFAVFYDVMHHLLKKKVYADQAIFSELRLVAFLLANAGFWFGSLYGDRFSAHFYLYGWAFSLLWLGWLLVVFTKMKKEKVITWVNISLLLIGFLFYTQWFVAFGLSGWSLMTASALAIFFLLCVDRWNMKLNRQTKLNYL